VAWLLRKQEISEVTRSLNKRYLEGKMIKWEVIADLVT
jgi:hypothetical protein